MAAADTVVHTLSAQAFDCVIFDLDGVVTRTASLHAESWKTMFDDYLRQRGSRDHVEYRLFDVEADYLQYVDGKPRYAGVERVLESRHIKLPFGHPDDPPGKESVCGLGNRKNQIFEARLRDGVEVYKSTIELIKTLRAYGVKTAVVSSSKNCGPVLEATHLSDLFDARVDGLDISKRKLEGKPSPDIFIAAARDLGSPPHRTVIVEDAIAGVQAGSRGKFGLVIGVDRTGQRQALLENGAHIVVTDLSQIHVAGTSSTMGQAPTPLPHALSALAQIKQRLRTLRPVIFLDYDGTLTAIVEHPKRAVLSEDMRQTVRQLAHRFPIAVISGRDLNDVRERVGIENINYAGSHGFDIAVPGKRHIEYQKGRAFLPELDSTENALKQRLADIPGALVERKHFSITVHFRQVPEHRLPELERTVDDVFRQHPRLRRSSGKKTIELLPGLDWDKGKAVEWLLRSLKLDQPGNLPIYIGDDVTDEDAFRALQDKGIGIVVGNAQMHSAAHYYLRDIAEVRRFLACLAGGEEQ